VPGPGICETADDGSYLLVVENAPDPLDLAVLEERLAGAAVAAVGAGEEKDFGIFVRDDHQRVVAGASGTTWAGCCQVHAVWVDDVLRDRGLGRALMAEAEAEARRRGCRLIMGLTYEVLTADFYDRLGYRIVGAIDDCPAGTSTRWYCKDL
jgi:GNAT superfamily N-acetyltransferase